MRKAYQSDLSNAEWGCLEPHLPTPDVLASIARARSSTPSSTSRRAAAPSDCCPGWTQKTLSWTAEIVRHPPKPAPEEVMRWAREWAKEGVALDTRKFMPQKGPRSFLPKRRMVESTLSWLVQNRRMSKDYERLPESSEAFIYVAMSRLMARRLARS